ncbi:MAG: hypothetical protein P8P85_00375, partial [Acidimicrobiales bacterium]|nr:hypothetical protein [Acidimicrobiales bacterium]
MTTQPVRIRVPLLIALIALIVASCGGADDVAPVANASSNDAASNDDDIAAEPDGDTAAEPDDGTGSIETYCRVKAEVDGLFDEADLFDPESVEAAVRGNVELIDAAIDIAPDEIRDDLRTLRQGFDEFITVLEDNAWDFFAATPGLEEVSARPEFEAAESRIENWEDANCDFSEDEDVVDEDPFSTPEAFEAMLSSDAGRAMMIEGMTEDGELTVDQAECMLDNLGFEALSALSTEAEPSPEVVALIFEIAARCGLEDMFGFEDMDDADDAGMSLDAEMLEAMLLTESGRAMMIEGMT